MVQTIRERVIASITKVSISPSTTIQKGLTLTFDVEVRSKAIPFRPIVDVALYSDKNRYTKREVSYVSGALGITPWGNPNIVQVNMDTSGFATGTYSVEVTLRASIVGVRGIALQIKTDVPQVTVR